MKKIDYTFIIPAYNCSKTIVSCLNSIINDIESSLLSNDLFEIIVVENGSIDNTIEVIEKYKDAKRKINIKLLHSEKGVSKARNLGILNSCGQYLIFVDSDDIWLDGSLKKINRDVTEKDTDLFLYSYIKGKNTDNFQNCQKIIHNEKVNLLDNFEKKKSWMISMPTLRMQCWAKVFKRDIFVKNKIYFDENIKYSEDSEMVIRYLSCCNNLNVSSFPIYKYVLSENSVMRSFDEKRIEQYINSLRKTLKFMDKSNLQCALSQYVLIHLNIIMVHDIFIYGNNKNIKEDINKMKKILKNDVFSNSLKNISIGKCLNFYLTPEFFLKCHMYFMTAVICYIKSYKNQIKSRKV